ncbi:hypothetical protein LSAT2_015849 [Lamellibrachia satsuma]|nr:hypothetical protein LSAT2_015849 [Lamellibrachia satsuma]
MITDCSRRCQPGGTLDKECSLCLCAGDVVKGKVIDSSTSVALSDVTIYVIGREWAYIAITDDTGKFELNGICREGLRLKAIREGYQAVTQDVPASGVVAITITSE